MPYSPSLDATLILRKLTAPGPDTGEVIEYYYEPSDRAVHAYQLTSADQRTFTLPVSVIIDRWCLDPGQPPYTERRVTHFSLQSTGIRLTDVDGVTACQLTCTLAVTLTASPTADGRGYLTAQVSGAQGPVLLSLDGFQTPGVAPDASGRYEFGPHRTGTYTVQARETRSAGFGCIAQATATLTAGYGPRYRLRFKDRDNATCEALLYQRDYTGATEDLGHGQATPVVLDWPGGITDHLFSQALRGSECQLGLYLTELGQLLPLYSGDERLFRVHVSRATVEVWRGWLLPEQYDVAFLAPPNTFNLRATDGLGTLSGLPFVGSVGERLFGDWPVLRVLLHCLGQLELGLPLHTRVNVYPFGGNADTPALLQVKVDVAGYADSDGKPWDCGKVLAAVLAGLQVRLYQQAGAWWLERLAELTLAPALYLAFAPDGTRLADVTRAQPLTTIVHPNDGRPYWQGAVQRQGLRPAVAVVRVATEPGDVTDLLAFARPRNSDIPGLPLNWRAVASNGADFASTVYDKREGPPLLRLAGTAGPPFGYTNSAAQYAALLGSPYVELPLTPPLPLPFARPSVRDADGFFVRIKYKAYGFTPSDETGKQAQAGVALKYGSSWLVPFLSSPEQATPYVQGFPLNASGEQEVVMLAYATQQNGPLPVTLRLYAPNGSATAATVDISSVALEYQHSTPQVAGGYANFYESVTDSYLSRVDEGEKLFHTDTPHVRRAGTWLDTSGQPTLGWCEAKAPGVVQDLGDYAVGYRQAWQLTPAQVLSGVLRGPLPGIGALLTDPAEARPAVYVLTSGTYDVAANTWQVSGAQDLLLTPPVVRLPDNAIYNEDETAWQGEDDRILVYENA